MCKKNLILYYKNVKIVPKIQWCFECSEINNKNGIENNNKKIIDSDHHYYDGLGLHRVDARY